VFADLTTIEYSKRSVVFGVSIHARYIFSNVLSTFKSYTADIAPTQAASVIDVLYPIFVPFL